MEWETKTVNLGIVEGTSAHTIEFKAIGDLKLSIKNIHLSCGCLKASVKEDKIKVKFKVGVFPKHLENEQVYSTTRTIIITYKNNTKDFLVIQALIKRK